MLWTFSLSVLPILLLLASRSTWYNTRNSFLSNSIATEEIILVDLAVARRIDHEKNVLP